MAADQDSVQQVSLMDAGPCITFCAVNREAVLYEVLSAKYALFVPDVVDDEIRRKKGQRFQAVQGGWNKLVDNGHVGVLDSSAGDKELENEVQRIAGMPLAVRMQQSKNLGELVAICHACVRIRRGENAVLLIDDGDGTLLAHQNQVATISTEKVLRWSILMGKIDNRGDLKALYARMREVDQALVPVENTSLLEKTLWKKAFENRQR